MSEKTAALIKYRQDLVVLLAAIDALDATIVAITDAGEEATAQAAADAVRAVYTTMTGDSLSY